MIERDSTAYNGERHRISPDGQIGAPCRNTKDDGEWEHEGALQPTKMTRGLAQYLTDEQNGK
jgi:hypothetical protein